MNIEHIDLDGVIEAIGESNEYYVGYYVGVGWGITQLVGVNGVFRDQWDSHTGPVSGQVAGPFATEAEAEAFLKGE